MSRLGKGGFTPVLKLLIPKLLRSRISNKQGYLYSTDTRHFAHFPNS